MKVEGIITAYSVVHVINLPRINHGSLFMLLDESFQWAKTFLLILVFESIGLVASDPNFQSWSWVRISVVKCMRPKPAYPRTRI